MKKRIVIFGSTGSIGTQTLEIVSKNRSDFEVVGLAAGNNTELLKKQIEEFQPGLHYCLDKNFSKTDSLLELVQNVDFDLLVAGASGMSSLDAVLFCLKNKIPVALANKEIIVSEGEKFREICGGAPVFTDPPSIIPVDSEHSALFQCLIGESVEHVKRVIITASGGALRDKNEEALEKVSASEVLSHPTWKMGKKVTVDSATLVNKAVAVIEAHYLFGIPYEKIEVRLHRESKVHAIVDFVDGNSKIVLSEPDMRMPIQYALYYPERRESEIEGFDYSTDLHFELLKEGRYPCFDFVTDVARSRPKKLANLVNKDEEAVDMFLNGKIAFTEILTHLKSCL
jgi:1-deoxy-D-xylulose-5-phosphate reductoisomerase